MGRELKRVPLDFNWPMNKIWIGYINPYRGRAVQCPVCRGSGYSREAQVFCDQWHGNAPFDPAAYGAEPIARDNGAVRRMARRNVEQGPDFYGVAGAGAWEVDGAVDREAERLWRDCFSGHWNHHLIQEDVDALVKENRLWDFTRVPRNGEQVEIVKKKIEAGGNSWLPESNGYVPTAAEVNAWSIGGFGHDAFNRSICIRARCEREGVPVNCERCHGEGDVWQNPQDKVLCEAWKEEDPPVGPGYQLWTTTSDGAPISPVSDTLDLLCRWAEKNATTFGSHRATKDEWKKMLEDGCVYHKDECGAVFM